MNTKLLIGVGAVVAISLLIYAITRPEEAVAPIEEPAARSEAPIAPSEDDAGINSAADPSSSERTVEPAPITQKSVSLKNEVEVTQSSTSAQPSLPYNVVVVYTGERFIPDKITVIQGGTVRFVNTSDTQMWIASDNHPTHTRYPVKSETDCGGSSFDQCIAVGNGGSWSFVFTRTGTWGYHNHVRARDTGDIVVRTEEEYLKSR